MGLIDKLIEAKTNFFGQIAIWNNFSLFSFLYNKHFVNFKWWETLKKPERDGPWVGNGWKWQTWSLERRTAIVKQNTELKTDWLDINIALLKNTEFHNVNCFTWSKSLKQNFTFKSTKFRQINQMRPDFEDSSAALIFKMLLN